MTLPIRNKVAVVGVGYSKVARHADVSVGALAVEACKKAVDDAGLEMEDIDGISNYPSPSRAGAGTVDGVDFVGINYIGKALNMKQLRWSCSITQGTVTTALIQAANAVATGACNYALVWRAMHNPEGQGVGMARAPYASGDSQFMMPYGAGSPIAGMAGFMYSRYMAKYGATREHMATFIVNNRKNASMNPDAVFYNQPITREDYLNTRMVAEPMSLLDCDMYVDGCGAMVVTTADRARHLRWPPAYIAGFAQSMNYHNSPLMLLEHAMESERLLGKTLWENSGFTAKDVDQPNVYEGFSPFIYWWLESLGFCNEGEAFEYIQEGRIEFDGECPLNTAGGNLGMGRLHGTPHLIEAVLQLWGRCGPRQVKDPKVTLAVVGAPTMAGGLVFTNEP